MKSRRLYTTTKLFDYVLKVLLHPYMHACMYIYVWIKIIIVKVCLLLDIHFQFFIYLISQWRYSCIALGFRTSNDYYGFQRACKRGHVFLFTPLSNTPTIGTQWIEAIVWPKFLFATLRMWVFCGFNTLRHRIQQTCRFGRVNMY